MSITLTLVDHEANAIEPLRDLTLILLGDGRPLAKGVPEKDGVVRFDASLQGVKRLSVRAEWP